MKGYFLDWLANDEFYNCLVFHRVIPDFMIEGGDMNGDEQVFLAI